MAPLLTPHRLLGWLTLARQSTSHAYSDEEVLLIEELARRAALAMEYAVLFQEAQAWTATLEVRVDERTRALSEANRAKSRLLAAASDRCRRAEPRVRLSDSAVATNSRKSVRSNCMWAW